MYLGYRYRSKLGWFFWFGPIHVTIRRNLDQAHRVQALPPSLSIGLLSETRNIHIPALFDSEKCSFSGPRAGMLGTIIITECANLINHL